MRLRPLTGWTIVVIFLGSLAYTAAFATASYLETTHLVDWIASDAATKGKAAADPRSQEARQRFVSTVRSALLAASGRPGTVLTRDGVAVAETPEGVRVTVQWAYPVFSYGGRTLLAVPLSVDRSISLRP
ncbi:MAG: hypothetical protein HYV93_11310 [Candidatus Rokubacteria bacterium]|nr:hypothetical protein [Candidatus Rokubacteria bacterium]